MCFCRSRFSGKAFHPVNTATYSTNKKTQNVACSDNFYLQISYFKEDCKSLFAASEAGFSL